MNQIQQAMRNKVNEALGEVESPLDIFVDTEYKTTIKLDNQLKKKTLTQTLVNTTH